MVDLQILNLILNKKDYSIINLNNLNADYFPAYRTEFEFIKNHYEKYKQVPDKQTFIDRFPDFKFFEVTESERYLVDGIQEEYLYNKTVPILQKMDELLTGENADSRKAVEYLVSKIPLLTRKLNVEAIDLVSQADKRLKIYEDKLENKDKSIIKTGLKELDEIITGWDRREELAVITGRTGMGKSWWLFFFLLNALKQGVTVGLYSGEMGADKVGYRIDTWMSNISNFKINKGFKDIKEQYEEHIEHFKKFNSSFYIITPKELGGPATVEKLRAFVEKYNIQLLGIDQFSLMEDTRRGRVTYERFGNISMDVKTMQMELGIPIIADAQLNRNAASKDVEEPGTEHLGGSDRIAQDATTILSIVQKEPGVEIRIMKSRDSKVGDKLLYHWDIDKGILTYIPSSNDATNGKYVEEIKEQYGKEGVDVF